MSDSGRRFWDREPWKVLSVWGRGSWKAHTGGQRERREKLVSHIQCP
jgi:hypothetical protein